MDRDYNENIEMDFEDNSYRYDHDTNRYYIFEDSQSNNYPEWKQRKKRISKLQFDEAINKREERKLERGGK